MAEGDSIKDEKLYQRLRQEGESQEKSARIANQAAREGRGSLGERGAEASNYQDRTVDELRDRAKQLGLTGFSQMNKQELIDALREH